MTARRLAAIVLFACNACFAAQATADSYPSRPIRLIVTFPPGGSADVLARTIQPRLEKRLGQPIVIENRPGAGGVTGIDVVARSAPDGYTIGIGAAGALAVNVSLKEKMPYDPFADLVPISGLVKTPFILAAAASFEPNSVRDIVALARAKPEAVAIGHGGNGTAMHLTAQLFNHMAGVNITLVPYRGTGPATQDVLAGHIPLAISDIPTALALIQSKQIKVLAVSTKERFEALPDVPTFEEAGLSGYESIGWFGFVAPAGTPPEVINKLNEAIIDGLKDPAMLEQVRSLGAIAMPGSPVQFARFIRSEYEKWAAVVAQTGAKEP
jgi:tripartite-type tricarboxylate transporter receptor subunit TctC